MNDDETKLNELLRAMPRQEFLAFAVGIYERGKREIFGGGEVTQLHIKKLNQLRQLLQERGQLGKRPDMKWLAPAAQEHHIHPDVLRYCSAELAHEDYFHAAFEAAKCVAARVRELSGLDADGADLIQRAFGLGKDGKPMLAINELKTETDRGVQRAFISFLTGFFGVVRNPLAHNPRVETQLSEREAVDFLAMASAIRRQLDKARVIS